MTVIYILAGLFGVCFGSFLNVLIYRLPNHMSLATPGSHCTTCDYSLRWYDNIPVISYILLGGKCRKCKQHISFRYTAVELLNTALWLLSVFCFWERSPLYAIAVAITCSLLICIAFIDLETMYMMDILTFLLAIPVVMTVVSKVLFGTPSGHWLDHVFGLCVGGGLFLLLYLGSLYILNKEGMGSGDVILMTFLGALLGWKATVFAVLIAAVVGCCVLIPIQYGQKKEAGTEYPFGPFLVFGAVVALFASEPFLGWYMSLFGL